MLATLTQLQLRSPLLHSVPPSSTSAPTHNDAPFGVLRRAARGARRKRRSCGPIPFGEKKNKGVFVFSPHMLGRGAQAVTLGYLATNMVGRCARGNQQRTSATRLDWMSRRSLRLREWCPPIFGLFVPQSLFGWQPRALDRLNRYRRWSPCHKFDDINSANGF